MYLIIRKSATGVDYFGPFPTEERAKNYAESFDELIGTKGFVIMPLIVPNCAQIKWIY